jgi:hypothetical protein
MFVISNDDGSLVDAGFSSDINAADIPPGYTKKRRVGSILTDSSSNIIFFRQDGNRFTIPGITEFSATGVSSIFTSLAITTPSGLNTGALITFIATFPLSSTTNMEYFTRDATMATGRQVLSTDRDSGNSAGDSNSDVVITDLIQQIQFRANVVNSNCRLDIICYGWIDYNL